MVSQYGSHDGEMILLLLFLQKQSLVFYGSHKKIHFLIMGNSLWAKHWAPFKALRQRYASTRFEEQRQLHLAPRRSTGPLSRHRNALGTPLPLVCVDEN